MEPCIEFIGTLQNRGFWLVKVCTYLDTYTIHIIICTYDPYQIRSCSQHSLRIRYQVSGPSGPFIEISCLDTGSRRHRQEIQHCKEPLWP